MCDTVKVCCDIEAKSYVTANKSYVTRALKFKRLYMSQDEIIQSPVTQHNSSCDTQKHQDSSCDTTQKGGSFDEKETYCMGSFGSGKLHLGVRIGIGLMQTNYRKILYKKSQIKPKIKLRRIHKMTILYKEMVEIPEIYELMMTDGTRIINTAFAGGKVVNVKLEDMYKKD